MQTNLKGLYSQIIDGFSSGIWNKKLIYFKHFSHYEVDLLAQEEEKIYKEAQERGLLSESVRIDQLIQEGSWNNSRENELFQQRQFLENCINTKKNLLLQEQINKKNKEIEETNTKINSIILERNSLVGLTLENWTSKKMNELHMVRSTFLDTKLTTIFLNKENDDLEDYELQELIELYNNSLDRLNKNIKKLAIGTFFQNILHLAPESIYEFYGKAITQLTILQQDVYIYGKFFSNILNSENKPSQELRDDPDKLIEQFQKNSNLKGAIGEGKGDLNGASVLGATKEELKNAGVDGKFINFRSKLKPGQTELSSIELAQIFQGSK